MESTQQVSEQGLDGPAPDWVGAWMPQRHVEIVAEIERLKEEVRQIESLGRLLWQTGPPLREAVLDVCRALGFETERHPAGETADLAVELGEGRRLLVLVTGTEASLTNRSPSIKRVFEATQELDEGTRVVLEGKVHRERPIADRDWIDPVASDDMMVINGIGVVFVTTTTLLRIWTR